MQKRFWQRFYGHCAARNRRGLFVWAVRHKPISEVSVLQEEGGGLGAVKGGGGALSLRPGTTHVSVPLPPKQFTRRVRDQVCKT